MSQAAAGQAPPVRRMGRPSTPRLSLHAIGHEALALLEEEGVLSLPRLAERLGVRQSAFYKHVSGRSDIVELARGALAERIPLPRLSGDLDTLVHQVFDVLRRTYQTVPALLPLILVQPMTHPEALAVYDRIAAAFEAAGVPKHLVLPAVETLDSAAIGAALDALTIESMWTFTDDQAAAFPNLAGARDALSTRPVDRFGFLADTLAAGLKRTAVPGPVAPAPEPADNQEKLS
jgi:AcrR family transcriptional regulator